MKSTRECSIDRYYDPTTAQFISVGPDVATTDRPYAFVDDDPLNATDPLGRTPCGPSSISTAEKAMLNATQKRIAISEKTLQNEENTLAILGDDRSPPTNTIAKNTKSLAVSIAATSVAALQYTANLALQSYQYLMARGATTKALEQARTLDEVADAAEGTAQEAETRIAAQSAWDLVGDADVSESYALLDLMSGLAGD